MNETFKRIISKYVILKINSGEWQVGHKIPSENALANKFGCSRMTLRNSLQLLTNSGVLAAKQGRGYLVAKTSDSMYIKNFSSQHNITKTEVIVESMKEKIIRVLKINSEDKIVTFIKNYYDDIGLLSTQYTVLNNDLIWKFDKELVNKSLTYYLSTQGSPIKKQIIQLEALEGIFDNDIIKWMGWGKVPIVEKITSYSEDNWIEKTLRITRKNNMKIVLSKNTYF